MKTATIQKFRLEFDAEFSRQFGMHAAAILQSGYLSDGTWVRRFEHDFAEFCGADHAVATSSGTTALEVALRAIDVGGEEVILPSNTFIATALAAERAGARLRLIDIESETLGLDPERLEKAISHHTAAVILVHIGGTISRYAEEISGICRSRGVPLVEDAAQAHGARSEAGRAGTIGEIAAFSFFPTKVMTAGEGGMVVTNNPVLAARAESIRDFGRAKRDGLISLREGMNARMTEFQGLLGVMELERLPGRIGRRRELVAKYAGCGLGVPLASESSHYKHIVRTRSEGARTRSFCEERGVQLSGEVYLYPVHEQPIYEGRWNAADFPVTNHFSKHHVCPPIYPEMTDSEVAYVSHVLKQADCDLD